MNPDPDPHSSERAAAPNYFTRLWFALRGRDGGPPLTDAESRARVAGLEMEVRERDERISRMREEYVLLERERDDAVAQAGEEALTRLFRKLSAPLATLGTVAHAAQEGQPVAVRELAGLVAGVEKALASCGLEPIGQPGGEVAFDSSLHQRMSGGSPHGGDRVRVRLLGYRHGCTVLQKAMVSDRDEA